jgi:hypothetical protein
MIRLNVNEQQLFDMIMAVYATGAEGGNTDAAATQRREALLDKLHRAFDNKIMTTQDGASAPSRIARPARRPVIRPA